VGALGLAVPARDARQPCAMSSISTSSGDGSSRSSRRPDSMRCQARGAVFLAILRGLLICAMLIFGLPSLGTRRMTMAGHQMVV